MGNEASSKAKIQKFTDLMAWQEGHKLVLAIYGATRLFPSEELYGLTSQLRRAVVSVTSNIAEGFSRISHKDKLNFYGIAHGSLTEVQNQLLIAKDIGYLPHITYTEISSIAETTHKLMTGLIKSMRTLK